MGEVCKTGSLTSRTSSLASSSCDPVSSYNPSIRSLQVVLDSELLRGVPLHLCLAGWARHWDSPDSGVKRWQCLSQARGQAVRSYQLSHPTTHLDNFLSHDWRTSRWLKLIALLVLFNSRAAAVATLLVTVLVGILRSLGFLPDEAWTVSIGYVTFAVVFAFWQRIRAMWKPRIVFMDKLCISQADRALKEAGILGLAAFLDNSRELTILWSPIYFKRLWCSYEVATFLRHTGNFRSVNVMPVKVALLLFVNAVQWFATAIAYSVITSSRGDDFSPGATLVLSASLTCLTLTMVPWTYYIGIGLMEDIQKLPEQFSNFRIQGTMSACCSQQHVHPESGKEIPCDRELVFSTLSEWYGKPEDSGDEHLDTFNTVVRRHLAPSVLRNVGGGNLPPGLTLYLVASCSVPFLADSIAQIAKGPVPDSSGADTLVWVWVLRACMDWAFVPVLAVFTTRLNFTIVRLALLRWSKYRIFQCKTCLTFVLSLLAMLIVSIYSVAFRVPSNRLGEDSLLPVLPFLFLLASTLGLFLHGRLVQTSTAVEKSSGSVKNVREKRTGKRGREPVTQPQPGDAPRNDAPLSEDEIMSI